MNIEEDRIRRSIEDLWSTVLGLAIEPQLEPSGPGSSRGLISGCVQITGAWEGAVALECAPTLARQAAAIMFGVEPGQTTVNQVQDALGELTNILGGQFKSFLPEPCRLSLPAIGEGADNPFIAPEDRAVAHYDFRYRDAPIRVTILEGNHETLS